MEPRYVSDVMTVVITPHDSDADPGLNVFQRRFRESIEITEVSFQCNSEFRPSFCAAVIDVLKNGETIFSELPWIEYGQCDSKAGRHQPVLLCSPTVFTPDDLLQIDLIQVPDGRGYTVDIHYRKRIAAATDSRIRVAHNEDFSCVTWNGKTYTFNESQSIVVRKLWLAWERGVPWVSKTTLLDEVSEFCPVNADRIRDIFKSGSKVNEAWGEMIVPESTPNTKQLFGLSRPD